MSKKKLTKKEKDFCSYFCENGDMEQSALLAGYQNPKKASNKLICRSDICDEIARTVKEKNKLKSSFVLIGLYRLAFSNVADAVSLLYENAPTKELINSLDLFSVSEIKRTDKSVEIKFFDRVKALEKLSALDEKESTSASTLLDALSSQAENAFDECGEISGV